MVTRALIEEVIDDYRYRVRIPTLNRSDSSPMTTSFENLYIATVACQPNSNPRFEIGDAVFVAFENNREGFPVIIGQLLRNAKTISNPEINVSTLNVNLDAFLPSLTHIGNVQPSEIKHLAGLNTNIQFQFKILEERIAKLEEKISKLEEGK